MFRELEIDVYNVNEGQNSSILEACEELKGCAHFVFRVRVHEKELVARGEKPGGEEAMMKAIRLAIQDCKDANLLKMFWEDMSQEEINMLANEWDMKTALEVREEEGFERGREEGVGIGMEKNRKELLALLDKGYTVEDLRRELAGTETASSTRQ